MGCRVDSAEKTGREVCPVFRGDGHSNPGPASRRLMRQGRLFRNPAASTRVHMSGLLENKTNDTRPPHQITSRRYCSLLLTSFSTRLGGGDITVNYGIRSYNKIFSLYMDTMHSISRL